MKDAALAWKRRISSHWVSRIESELESIPLVIAFKQRLNPSTFRNGETSCLFGRTFGFPSIERNASQKRIHNTYFCNTCFHEHEPRRELWAWRFAGRRVVGQSKRLNRRGFGEVYKALDKDCGTYVAIKETRLTASDAKIQSESEMLMKCNSPFIVRYKGVIRNGNKLWVRY